jgi:hypothetical protein
VKCAEPALVLLGPGFALKAHPAAQQELRQAMPGAHQISAHIVDTAHHVTEALIRFARHEREPKLTGGEEPHQPLGVAPVGLHPVARCSRDGPRRHNTNIQPALLGYPREHKPRWARLVHRGHRTIELLQERRHYSLRLATQALDAQLAGAGLQNSGDRLGLVNVEPDKGHTLRHGRHLP